VTLHLVDTDDGVALAIEVALAGAATGLVYFDRVAALDQREKADGSTVTEADLAVESEVRRVIAIARPSDAFIGEETGVAGLSYRRWILDGIDDTENARS
jgi:histidinol-phosphatase